MSIVNVLLMYDCNTALCTKVHRAVKMDDGTEIMKSTSVQYYCIIYVSVDC